MPTKFMAITLAIFKNGTVYGHVEKQGTEAEINAYIEEHTGRCTMLNLPPFLQLVDVVDYVLYGIEQTADCKNLQTSGPSPAASSRN